MGVVTISRQLGSGGTDVALLVAERLGYRLVNRELVDVVARRLGVHPSAAGELDERALGGLSAFVDSLVRSLAGEPLTVESYRYVAAHALREIAREGNAVILGRAGQVILARHPNTLHVHIGAPVEVRVERIRKSRGLSKQEARRVVEESDANRRGYVWQVAQADWTDPTLYDLMLNTHRLSIQAAADVVLCAARHRGIMPVEAVEEPRP